MIQSEGVSFNVKYSSVFWYHNITILISLFAIVANNHFLAFRRMCLAGEGAVLEGTSNWVTVTLAQEQVPLVRISQLAATLNQGQVPYRHLV